MGTFGAFILIRSPIRSTRALFDVGASGPLVGFFLAVPALAHQQRAPLSCCLDGEGRPVDEAHARVQGIDPQPVPRQVEEGQARDHLQLDPGVGPQQLDGSLRHQRRAGHGVEDLAVGCRRLHQGVHDPRVHLVERGGRVVQVVEGAEPAHRRRSRVARRTQIAVAGTIDGPAGGRGHELGPGRAQPDHDHPRRHGVVEPTPEETLPLAGTKLRVDDGGAEGGAIPARGPRIW